MASTQWLHSELESNKVLEQQWKSFLILNAVDLAPIKTVDFSSGVPIITDQLNRKFSIDFINDKKSYFKKKGSIKTELISKAMGSGRYGLSLLDLSAGLGVDSIFLAQLGYTVTALERNPLIYLALKSAHQNLKTDIEEKVNFVFISAQEFIKSDSYSHDITYFDPMFPEKKKSALSKQEMMFFREFVGTDPDAEDVIAEVLQAKKTKRLVVKRPLKAAPLFKKPQSSLLGKLIRFDIYSVNP